MVSPKSEHQVPASTPDGLVACSHSLGRQRMESNADLGKGSLLVLDIAALSLTANQGRTEKAAKQSLKDRIINTSLTAGNIKEIAERGSVPSNKSLPSPDALSDRDDYLSEDDG